MDCRYAHFELPRFELLLQRSLQQLAILLQSFRRVLIVRVPIKQEQVPERFQTEKLMRLRTNFDELWERTKSSLLSLPSVELDCPAAFRLGDYHPADSHWNASGNETFAKWLKAKLG
jgi:hypothetical protein